MTDNRGINDPGKVKDWHDPHDETCPQNINFALDCACKRPRKKKPFRAVRVHDEGVGRRVNPNIVLEIYHNGAVALRELRRKKRYWTTAADIYSWRIWQEGLKAAALQRQKRKERKLARKKTEKTC